MDSLQAHICESCSGTGKVYGKAPIKPSVRCDACGTTFESDGDIASTVELRAGAIWRVKLSLCLSCQRSVKSLFSGYVNAMRSARTVEIKEEPDEGRRNIIL